MTVTYISRSDVTALLPSGYSFTNDEIDAAITWVTSRVDDYVGESGYFTNTRSDTIREDGTGCGWCLIRSELRPLKTFTVVTIDDVDVDDISLVSYDDEYHMLESDDYVFYRGWRNVDITGTFGFSAVPTDVKNAMAWFCVSILIAGGVGDYLSTEADDPYVKQVKLDGVTVDFKSTKEKQVSHTITTGDKALDAVLDRYRYKYGFVKLIF